MRKILLLIIIAVCLAGCTQKAEVVKKQERNDSEWESLEEQQQQLDLLQRPNEFDLE